MEGIFEAQDGVIEAIAGYCGGSEEDATYQKVSSGTTAHREAVCVVYDPYKISYRTLLDFFWTQIDPTDAFGQFADKGFRYTTAIYYGNAEEYHIAETSKQNLQSGEKFSLPVQTVIEPFVSFYSAESYHQNYYATSAFRYALYKQGSGRENFIKENWNAEIQNLERLHQQNTQKSLQHLTELQYQVTQQCSTELPFDNEHWDNHRKGLYVDIVDGSPLFLSTDKFDSGSGWPSFVRPIDDYLLQEIFDESHGMRRTEVRGKSSNSHLGHVFTDGPKESGGLRYCINSASLRFVPYEKMEME